jgi:hypothetical protein
MMPDNWRFVIAAYGLAAIVLAAYWRFLFRLEKLLDHASVARRQLRQRSGVSEPQARRPSP